MTDLSEAQRDILRKAGSGHATLVMRIAAAEAFNIWLGPGDFDAGPTDLLAPNAIYTGCGLLRDMPVLQAMRNGQADAIDFSFVGGRGRLQGFANDPEATGIIDARVNIGLIGFDRDLQRIGNVYWFWPGRVGFVTSSGGPDGRIITLPVYHGNALRARPGLRRWSNASHQSRNPGDRICERTGLYRLTTIIKWPQ